MYGLIGKMNAAPGGRDALIAILLEGIAGMPGCLSYIVAADPAGGYRPHLRQAARAVDVLWGCGISVG